VGVHVSFINIPHLRDKDSHLVISDYEQSLIAAVETELPNARISSCFFHFGQNLWRRVQSLGLARDYRQNRRLKKAIRKVIAVGYLPMALR
jgi:hypothetical protein